MTRPDEDSTSTVQRIRGQINAVVREADTEVEAAPKRSRRLAVWVLLVSLLFSVVGAAIGVGVAIRTSGLDSADRLRDRSQERLDQNRRALDGLNLCLARLGERRVPGPLVDPDQADAWVAARAAALGRLVERGAGCPEQGVILASPAPTAPSTRTSPSSPTSTTPPTTSTAPSRSATPRAPTSPGAGAAPGAASPGGAGAAGAPGVPGPAGPAGPAAPPPARPRVLIPLLPEPLLPPLL